MHAKITSSLGANAAIRTKRQPIRFPLSKPLPAMVTHRPPGREHAATRPCPGLETASAHGRTARLTSDCIVAAARASGHTDEPDEPPPTPRREPYPVPRRRR